MQANDGQEQLLAQLHDIHAAASPSWWPPAPGWWVLAVLAMVLIAVTVRLLSRLLTERKRRRNWLQALAAVDSEFDPRLNAREYLSSLNRLFRAVALKAFPDTSCASLQGDDWVQFIRALLPESSDTQSISALARGPYEPGPEFDAPALLEQAKTWVRLYG